MNNADNNLGQAVAVKLFVSIPNYKPKINSSYRLVPTNSALRMKTTIFCDSGLLAIRVINVS
jgi:hypothetical protein